MKLEKEAPYEENDNIYKNSVEFEEPDFDAEKIDLDEEPQEAPVRKPITPIKPVMKQKPIQAKPVKRHSVRKKVVVKKATKEEKRKKSTPIWPWIVLIAAIVIAIVIVIWKFSAPAVDDKTLAKVNGEPIKQSDLDKRYNALNPLYKQLFTPEILLNQTIDEVLLLQEAKKQGVVLTTEVDDFIDAILEENNLTFEQFKTELTNNGITLEYFQELSGKRMLVDKLLNKTVFKDIAVTDAEIQDYYDEQSSLFVTPEEVLVRHVLVTGNDSAAVIQQIKKEFDNGTDFCELVADYSEDPGSMDNCGQYTFARGVMVAEFEDAAFDLGINETTIVQTQFGHHFMQLLDRTEEVQMPLEEVEEKIRETILFTKQEQAYVELVEQLRRSAVVERFDGVQIQGNVIKQTEQSQQQVQEPIQVQQQTKTADEIASCLNAKNAELYGAYWKADVKKQKDVFGNAFIELNYIECDPNIENSQANQCTEKDIATYPTWVIDGITYEGFKTLAELEQIAC